MVRFLGHFAYALIALTLAMSPQEIGYIFFGNAFQFIDHVSHAHGRAKLTVAETMYRKFRGSWVSVYFADRKMFRLN